MARATVLGFPRIGPKRELKKALEAYWSGKQSEAQLRDAVKAIRQANWQLQRARGIDLIPVNDFSLYDHVLDQAMTVGAIPPRYAPLANGTDLTQYFAMARGHQDPAKGIDVPALEMTKWFDTNYHYIVPEFEPGQTFKLSWRKVIEKFAEAKALGIEGRPVLVGPLTFLLLGKERHGQFDVLALLENLIPVYGELLNELKKAGAEWVQLDEPCLVLDLDAATLAAYEQSYARLAQLAPGIKILLATYFGDIGSNLATIVKLPIAGLHLDLVRGPGQLDAALKALPAGVILSCGVVDGRNVWRNDLEASIATVQKAVDALGTERVWVASSCSLQFTPVDLESETHLDAELKQWLAFAVQKLDELAIITKAINQGRDSVQGELAASALAAANHKTSRRIHDPAVKTRAGAVTEDDHRRDSAYAHRRTVQQERLNLPPLPTTTIGSFPQTHEIRQHRLAFNQGKLTAAEYEAFLEQEIAQCIAFQEEIGLDVLVHGESERTDMVEYFGQQLEGFAFTEHGWVQSYGSRCVRPPIIVGDVSRPNPMTVRWAQYAQSLSKKPVKGMLTGPVTILQWSFVRVDQPRSETCKQIALAIRDEVVDLEAAGIAVVQIDEPAIREGLPLRRGGWEAYMRWAVDAFRLATAGVRDETQIHTHMCYSEFNDMIEAIARLDADVISIESSRSQLELLDAFVEFAYPNEIGPGVYDIHSPRIPATAEMTSLLKKATGVLRPEQIWVNPDCGLKTRGWEEVKPALANMVSAAKALREITAAVPN